MSNRILAALLATLAALVHRPAWPATPATTGPDDTWLMMVATRCTDAAREAEFNTWYDDIDIPDVLEVPGYQRARRGLRLGTAEFPVEALPDDEGRYVALYDIASASIDKTIIEMLMATRKMETRGRSTDLLKVTERVYYHRLAPAIPARDRQAGLSGLETHQHEYLYIERIDCCHDAAAERRFNDWYVRKHVASVLSAPGFERASRYELYRVLMVEPKEATRYLTVYELEAGSQDAAILAMTAARKQLREAAAADSFVENGSMMFRKIRDVSRR